MEYAKRRKRRRRQGSGAGKAMAGLVMACLAVYVITASAAGKWLAEEVMAPAFTALSDLPIFSSDALDGLEQEQSAEDALSVSLSTDRSSVSGQVDLPSMEVYALQMGAFSSAGNAEAMAESLRGRGAGGYVYEDSGMYRVLAAGYGSEADARTVKDRLTGEGSDCTLYTISAPAVTFSITASEGQLSDIKGGFSALTEAQRALMEACVDFDANAMTVDEGIALIQGISGDLSAACAPLAEYREASPAMAAIDECCSKCLSSLSSLSTGSFASAADFSAQMKYALLELTDAYSSMLRNIAE